MTEDYYQILEVPKDSAADAIKKAYFTQVRKYPPNKKPNEFKRVRQAYEVLSDEKARKLYDAQLTHGTEIASLFERTDEAMDKEAWPEALRFLKRIIVLSPEQYNAHNLIGLCYLHLEDYPNALKTYKKLTSQAEDVALYWRNYAFAYLELAKDCDEDDPDASGYYEQARTIMRRALELEPFNSEPINFIARTYIAESNYTQAEKVLNEEINKDNQLTMRDLELLFTLCEVYLISGRPKKVITVADQICQFIPDEEQARGYVAYRFSQFAEDLFKAKLFNPALYFLKAATRFDPSPELKEWYTVAKNLAKAEEQITHLQNDDQIVEPMKKITTLFFLDAIGSSKEYVNDREKLVDTIMGTLDDYTAEAVVASVVKINKQYRQLYKLCPEFYQELIKAGTEICQRRQTVQSSSSGCFVVTATFAYEDQGIVADYRLFREQHLKPSRLGRVLIAIYNVIGPPLAGLIRRAPLLRRMSRNLLLKVHALLPIETCKMRAKKSKLRQRMRNR